MRGVDERAAEIREAVDALLDRLGFGEPLDVQAGRQLTCMGIYVLFLAEGLYYVGMSENIGDRLRSHLGGGERTHRVNHLRTLEAGRETLRKLEQQVLELVEDAGAPVVNVDLARRSEASLPFDQLLSREEQDAWVLDPGSAVDAVSRRDYAAQRMKYEDRFRRFVALPEAEDGVTFLEWVVRRLIPLPRATEGEYYLVSCLPSTGGGRTIVRVNAGRQELAAMHWDRLGQPFYYIMCPVLSLRRTLGRLQRKRPGLQVTERAWRAGGRDQGAVDADSLEDVKAFLDHPVVAQQLRRFNLRIIRGGRAFWRNSHCPQLLDGIL